ncbi:nudix hydrolase [gamma proteobacterium HTCC5015]|nr:nudix hydrolase [gamma proteobacterium HTCC5015]
MNDALKSIDDPLRDPPEVLSVAPLPPEQVVKSGVMKLEQLHLRFSNGVERYYQRMQRGRGAVMMVALQDRDTALLIREFAAGTGRYELVLPKGRIDAGEAVLEAANRELMEEVGVGGRELREINSFTLAPTFMGHETHVVLVTDLYPQRLEGDEPEELEVIPWRLDALHELAAREECTEGRTLAALYYVRDLIERGFVDV